MIIRIREVDQFGNVSYSIHDGGRVLGCVLKGGGTGWRAETPWGSWAPVTSVKAGEAWLAGLWTVRRLPRDPRTVTEMIPVRQAEITARGPQTCSRDAGHGAMVPRPLETQTYEVMYCGVWYECSQGDCSGTVHYLSRELAAYHGEPYVIRAGEYEAWNGTEWVPVTQAQFDAYWTRRLAAGERQHKDMIKRARGSRRGQKATAR